MDTSRPSGIVRAKGLPPTNSGTSLCCMKKGEDESMTSLIGSLSPMEVFIRGWEENFKNRGTAPIPY
uniref:Uncharacterized protein n=1 Tax=Utricularia reniformis TaxID=192314 RepID=A0A1Y0B245_9LAMI|nr:hypothetical protein AEK19_MT1263 [Utricularia reniformis]ART31470.1 hypothetical protein AEK19_MT1263 [Utricularia reniformis]